MAALGKRAKGIPLSLVIVRYFAYILVSFAAVWLAALTGLSAAIGAGAVYPANYGAANMQATAEGIVANGCIDPANLPTPYRCAIVDAEGSTVQATMSDEQAALGWSLFAEQPRVQTSGIAQVLGTTSTSGATYALIRLYDGNLCLLASDYLPHFVDPALARTLPNPQNLMLLFACAASAGAIALIARRASKVLTRKMEPLTRAADKIAHEELSFDIEPSNVKQINAVIHAMDTMRASLATSLQQRWLAEQSQRDQIAALAHDLKTPLTIIMANADFIAEETRSLRDVADAAQDISAAAKRADEYVGLLLDASRGDERPRNTARISVLALYEEWSDAGRALARTARKDFDAALDTSLEHRSLSGSSADIGRALSNVLANACDHACTRVSMRFTFDDASTTEDRLVIEITDDGAGFSPEALAHACERFYRDDASRTIAEDAPHYGIGLFVAAQATRAHGGSLRLDNVRDAKGAPLGALVALSLPLDA